MSTVRSMFETIRTLFGFSRPEEGLCNEVTWRPENAIDRCIAEARANALSNRMNSQLAANKAHAKMQQALKARHQEDIEQQLMGTQMGGGAGLGGQLGVAAMATQPLSDLQVGLNAVYGSNVGTGTKSSVRISVGTAIENDIKKQGGEVKDADRVARAAVREIRSVGDEVFKAAGVKPEFHKETFIKIIDEIMKGL